MASVCVTNCLSALLNWLAEKRSIRAGVLRQRAGCVRSASMGAARGRPAGSLYIPPIKRRNQIKSNLFAINKMHNITVHKITFHLAGQTGDSFALMSAHKD